MKIEIIAPTRIEIDGVDAGWPLDVFLASPELRQQIKVAFVEWHASHVIADQVRDAARDAEIKRTKEESALAQDRVEKEAAARIADAEMIAEILGTKEDAQEAIRSKRKAELLKELSDLESREVPANG